MLLGLAAPYEFCPQYLYDCISTHASRYITIGEHIHSQLDRNEIQILSMGKESATWTHICIERHVERHHRNKKEKAQTETDHG